ncbi:MULTISPECIES: ChaN family lipoprotein [Thioclava]|uniref:ChaN family lipoprotein n=1 Tax=Thioclava TaxID=285107 RepID=UPI000C5F064A|nr:MULTISPECIES: ChaN family lipoprotein [Thioclava]MAQ38523.1 hypothetical protein [Thioclava sp.]|tara:strand:- start:286 stop:1098 length:813 start_codon:yes stop_codon:yes gene_type:complete
MKKFLAALCLLSLTGPAFGAEISPAQLDTLSGDIVVLGEIHDNPTHHLNQARAIKALKPAAVVFEQLTPEQAAKITPALLRDEGALAKALDWDNSGWPDFAIYYPIFAALGDAKVYGAAQPRDTVRAAMTKPLPEVFGPNAARYGLDKAYPEDLQAKLEAESQEDHCNALPPDLLPGMVAAQRFRDAAFARVALEALKETGGPVAVITGSGHAKTDLAVPALLRKADPQAKVVAIGQIEAEPGTDTGTQPFDDWIITPPTERADPCAAFK